MSAKVESTTIPRIRKNASCNVLRENYQKHPTFSYREASDYSGLSINYLQGLVCKGKLALKCRYGSFRIARSDLDNYLQGNGPEQKSVRQPRLASKEK